MSISQRERDRRYSAIRDLMIKNGLDRLLVAGRAGHLSRGNIRYITNYGSVAGAEYCIFPLEGSPIVVRGKGPGLSKLIKAGWILDFRQTSNPAEQVIKELAQSDKGNKIGIVGMGDISVPMYLAVQEQFSDRLVDATEIFRQLRLIKSAEEIEKMRVSASVADKVFTLLKDMIRPGLTDYEIYSEVKRIIHKMGCDYSFDLIDAEGAKMNLFYPTGDRLEANGTLALEITPSYEGYYTQLPVTLPVGEYPHHIHKMIPVWKQALKAAVDILGPGTKVCDIHLAIEKVVHTAGYISPWRHGHGVGLDLIDLWFLSESDSMELRSGMTLVLHPNLLLDPESEGNGPSLGYTYLITDTGSEKLNKVCTVD
jgi:Xaa-Pro dipeptidase